MFATCHRRKPELCGSFEQQGNGGCEIMGRKKNEKGPCVYIIDPINLVMSHCCRSKTIFHVHAHTTYVIVTRTCNLYLLPWNCLDTFEARSLLDLCSYCYASALGHWERKWKSLSQLYWSTTVMPFRVGFTAPLEAFLIFFRAHLYSPPSVSLLASCDWFQSNYSQEYLHSLLSPSCSQWWITAHRYVPLHVLVRSFGLLLYHSQQGLAKMHYKEDNATCTYLERTYIHVHVEQAVVQHAIAKMVVVRKSQVYKNLSQYLHQSCIYGVSEKAALRISCWMLFSISATVKQVFIPVIWTRICIRK